MVLLGLEVLVGTYIGTRVFNHFKVKKNRPKPNSGHLKLNQKATQISSLNITPTKTEKETDHYFKASTVSVGLVVGGYFYAPIRFLGILSTSYATVPILVETQKSLSERKLKNDLLIFLVSVGCFVMGQYLTATLAAWFYQLGNKMVEKTQNHSQEILTNIFGQQPKNAWILKDEVEIEVPLDTVQLNDIVVVDMGGVISIDGEIIKGMAMIDQHVLTGESMPVEKWVGEQVFASTIILSGKIWIKVEQTGLDTNLSKITHILTHTVEFKTYLQSRAEKWADNAAKPLLGIGAVFLPIVGIPPTMTILYSSPGSDIKVLASLQTLKHLTLAYQKGLLVKDGRALENLLKVDTVLFDKTGTLTSVEPEVGQIILCDDFQENDILTYAAAAERKLTHPIARAIVAKAEEFNLYLPDIDNASYQMSYGITVDINNKTIKVGSTRFMEMEGIIIPDKIKKAQAHCDTEGYSLVMLSVEHKIKGAIEIQPQVRSEASQVIQELRQRGIKHIAIVSGDRKQPTKKLAKTLGMDDYFYDFLPQDKAMLIEELQKEGKTVCFVGDGINDAIAMKKSDVSVSMLGATSIATDTAQVVLMDGGLSHLSYLFDISKQLDMKMKQTLFLCTGYGIANFCGAVFFHFTILYSFIIGTIEYSIGVINAGNSQRH